MIKVGLTGGIGSGKSTVCRIFEHLGVKTYNSDERSKSIVQSHVGLINSIKKEFGEHIYHDGSILDKKKLSDIVFKDPEALNKLNALVHPAVGEDFADWCRQNENEAYIIKESAILFESGVYKNLDIMITVFAPLEVRIDRIIKRDMVNREKVLEIISNQIPDEQKMEKSDYVIMSDDKHSLIEQVLALDKEFRF